MLPTAKQTREVAKIVTTHPTLLQLDVVANLEPTAKFLQHSCNLKGDQPAAVVAGTPGAPGLSVEARSRCHGLFTFFAPFDDAVRFRAGRPVGRRGRAPRRQIDQGSKAKDERDDGTSAEIARMRLGACLCAHAFKELNFKARAHGFDASVSAFEER